MTTWLYDGSFEGWLSAVFQLYQRKASTVRLRKEEGYVQGLFESVESIATVAEDAARVWAGLGQRLSGGGLRDFYCSYLAETEGEEDNMLGFVQYVFSTASNVEKDFSNAHVVRMHHIARKVMREKHHMEAFVRFKLTPDDMYFAGIEPQFNVLPLIMKHFKDRYADQRWMIYDNGRRYGMYYDGETVCPVQLDFSGRELEKASRVGVWTPEEDLYQALWKTYYQETNIPARRNRKLQLQHMPRRYWKYMTEVQDEA